MSILLKYYTYLFTIYYGNISLICIQKYLKEMKYHYIYHILINT